MRSRGIVNGRTGHHGYSCPLRAPAQMRIVMCVLEGRICELSVAVGHRSAGILPASSLCWMQAGSPRYYSPTTRRCARSRAECGRTAGELHRTNGEFGPLLRLELFLRALFLAGAEKFLETFARFLHGCTRGAAKRSADGPGRARGGGDNLGHHFFHHGHRQLS